jgi:hypothetical protein
MEDSHKWEEAHTAGAEHNCWLHLVAAGHSFDGLLLPSLIYVCNSAASA